MVGLRPRPASERRVGSSGPIMGSGVDGLLSPSTLVSSEAFTGTLGRREFFSIGFAKLVESEPGATRAR